MNSLFFTNKFLVELEAWLIIVYDLTPLKPIDNVFTH